MNGVDLNYKIIILWMIGLAGLMILSSAFYITLSHRKPVIQYTTTKSVDVTVYLVYSENDQPAYYTTRLQSPVCMEDLCNPIDIQVEWDLLGDFKGYIENQNDLLQNLPISAVVELK